MLEKFKAKKREILNRLSIPDKNYADLSPKGSVDEQIRGLIGKINSTPGFITTSSCAGRIAVFVDGRQERPAGNSDEPSIENDVSASASAGGKGGGKWLYTSHSPCELEKFSDPGKVFELLGFPANAEVSFPSPDETPKFVHLKFEPMILHILTASAESAQLALRAALTAGFRESGIGGLTDARSRPTPPMVAVRSSGLALDSIIGFQAANRQVIPMVPEEYLRTLLQLANSRFTLNEERKARFMNNFLDGILAGGLVPSDAHVDRSESSELPALRRSGSFEPRAVQREKKRREGLARREQSLAFGGALDGTERGSTKSGAGDEDEDDDEDFGFDLFDEDDDQDQDYDVDADRDNDHG